MPHIKENYAFSCEYTFEVVNENTEKMLVYSYPEIVQMDGFYQIGSQDNFLIKFYSPKNWLGIFKSDTPKTNYSQIDTCPNSSFLSITNHGKVYYVNTLNPLDCKVLNIYPVNNSIALHEHNLIVYITNLDIFAIDKNGLKWQTGRVALDGIKYVNTDKNNLYVQVYDLASDSEVILTLNLENGKVLNPIKIPFN